MSKLLIDLLRESVDSIFARYGFSPELVEVNNIYSILRFSYMGIQVDIHVDEMEEYYYYEVYERSNGKTIVFSSTNRLAEHSILELLPDAQIQYYMKKQMAPRKIKDQIYNDRLLLGMVLPLLIKRL